MLQQSLDMWGRFVEQVRRVGPRRLAIYALAAAVAVVLAYGVNSTNDAANSQTLPHATHAALPAHSATP